MCEGYLGFMFKFKISLWLCYESWSSKFNIRKIFGLFWVIYKQVHWWVKKIILFDSDNIQQNLTGYVSQGYVWKADVNKETVCWVRGDLKLDWLNKTLKPKLGCRKSKEIVRKIEINTKYVRTICYGR